MPLKKGWNKKRRDKRIVLPKPAPFTRTKGALKSKAVNGGILILLSLIFKYNGFSVDSETKREIIFHSSNILSFLGGLLVIFGRIKASKKLN